MRIILSIVALVLLTATFAAPASAKVEYCKVRDSYGNKVKYVKQPGWVCPNWKYIKCDINGETRWFIGGIKGEAFTNNCPTSIQHTAP